MYMPSSGMHIISKLMHNGRANGGFYKGAGVNLGYFEGDSHVVGFEVPPP